MWLVYESLNKKKKSCLSRDKNEKYPKTRKITEISHVRAL